MIAPLVGSLAPQALSGGAAVEGTVGKLARGSQKADGDAKLCEAARQFEQVLIKQMLKPLEDSLSKAMGTENANPMIGSLVLDTVSNSITAGGGLGFADIIEQSLRSRTHESASEKESPK